MKCRFWLAWALLLAGIVCLSQQTRATWQSRDSNYNVVIASGSAAVTWNPSDADAGIVLSNGNLTATSSNAGQCAVSGFCGVRATVSHTTGKFYHEVTVTTLGGAANDNNVGIANASASLGTFLGNGTNGNAYRFGGSNVGGNACPDLPGAFASGDTLGIATDLGGALQWMRVNAGSYNNSGGAADPASGTRGCDISNLNPGPAFFPAISGSNDANTIFTANFGATAYANSAPAGFGNW